MRAHKLYKYGIAKKPRRKRRTKKRKSSVGAGKREGMRWRWENKVVGLVPVSPGHVPHALRPK